MNCPRCQGVVLDERERDGVVVDVCRTCRGMWLDRGELEKLIVRTRSEVEELAPRRRDTPPRGIYYSTGDHDDDDHQRDYRGARKKRSWFESLGDIFD